ncbi:integrating conjugative element protein, PFL_4709 family [Pseudomonas asturiensis]|uniref:Integrating conjugative element protein, PFL_4709 family n=1 Tax=Pseudomonas asturiensis TaxID=1190415 RepID=A0A1M7PCN1_9PSED|nr:TIGR03757 family integrating conjugative element protein [Pseudomonas asturiensis]SHN14333.1 integrating conjugative element protein, PFL_4709 family [Pseudomonas asturiensis]
MPPYLSFLNPRSCLALFTVTAITVPTLVNAETWVVTDRSHPIQVPAGVRLILLDDSERLETKLSEGLPADPLKATAAIQQRLRTADAQRLQQDLVTAQQNLVDAWSTGITKIPAVVVDRKFVVYGESNVAVALGLIKSRQGEQQ